MRGGAALLCLLCLLCLLWAWACGTPVPTPSEGEGEGEGEAEPVVPQFLGEEGALSSQTLGLVVNADDPLSVEIAVHYALARGIPPEHIVRVHLPVAPVADADSFAVAKALVDALPDDVQGLALAWTQPYGVGCMSITSAFALGFDEARYCRVYPPCAGTETVVTYDDDSRLPFTDHGIRPAMLLAGTSIENVDATIARGIAADDTFPSGTGYLVDTSDPARTVRAAHFADIVAEWDHEGGLALQHVEADSIANKTDVLVYFTGLADVPDIATNTYHPGAVADHLTSFGGQVPTSFQMSALRWLEAGATASYGTVVEPCAFTAKFPDPRVFLSHYFRGEPLLEAYWKSVAAPGEGVFIGEPLARPYGRDDVVFDAETLTLTVTTNRMASGHAYVVEGADDAAGPWQEVKRLAVIDAARTPIVIHPATYAFYRLRTL